MKRIIVNAIDKVAVKVISHNANSTTSFAAYQPKPPVELKKFNKTNNK